MDATEPTGELTLRTLAMPRDVNVNGDIFGGWVLSQMDIAAGITAGSRAAGAAEDDPQPRCERYLWLSV